MYRNKVPFVLPMYFRERFWSSCSSPCFESFDDSGHKSTQLMLFLFLPKYVLVSILSQWLKLKEICRLDSSFCNKEQRQMLLTLFSIQTVSFHGELDRCSKSKLSKCGRWVISRNIVLKHVYWYFASESKLTDSLMSSSKKQEIQLCESLTLINESFMEFSNAAYSRLTCENLEARGETLSISYRFLGDLSVNCSFLKSIHFHHCRGVQHRILDIELRFPVLIEVSLMCCVDFANTFEAILNASQLEKIMFKNCAVSLLPTDTDGFHLSERLSCLRELFIESRGSLLCEKRVIDNYELFVFCALNLKRIHIDLPATHTNAVMKGFDQCKQLRYVEEFNIVNTSGISDYNVLSLVKSCPFLTELKLLDCQPLKPATIMFLTESLGSQLKVLKVSVMRLSLQHWKSFLPALTNLLEIELRISFSPDETLENAHSTSTNHNLFAVGCCALLEKVTLRVYAERYTPSGALEEYANDDVLTFITNCAPNITHLSVLDSLTDCTVIYMLSKLRKLIVLHLTNGRLLTKLFTRHMARFPHPKLVELKLSNCGISMYDVYYMVRENRILKRIQLSPPYASLCTHQEVVDYHRIASVQANAKAWLKLKCKHVTVV